MAIQPPESPSASPEPLSPEDYAVFHYFIEQQRDNPAYWNELADQLWAALSPEEQVARTALNASFFPDDLTDRSRSIKVGLLRDYIGQQVLQTRALDDAYRLEADGTGLPPAEI